MKTRTIIAALFIATMQADAITIDLGPPSTLYHGAKLFDPDISVQFPKPITFLQGQSLSFDIVFAHQGLTEFLQIPAAPRDTTAIVGLFCALQVSGVGLFQMPLSNTYTFDASGVRNSPIQSFGGSVLNDDPGRIFSYSIGTVFPINPSDPVVYPFMSISRLSPSNRT